MSTISVRRCDTVVTVLLGSPILSQSVLSDLTETLAALAAESSPPAVVLASDHPSIFLAGAHLGEIAELDVRRCVPYSRLGRSVADALDSHPAPVVAAVHGSCSGGGFDLVMACDAVIASPDATFAHPGVRRGLVTGWGGTERLASVLGPGVMASTFLEGATLDAATLKGLGAVRTITSNPRREAVSAARDLARIHPSRWAVWRRLRGPSFVDRFRAFVVEKS